MHLTFNQAKRIRPAAAPRVSVCVVLTRDGSMWLDLPGSLGDVAAKPSSRGIKGHHPTRVMALLFFEGEVVLVGAMRLCGGSRSTGFGYSRGLAG